MSAAEPLLAPPFPWFGGKSRVASQVWGALGDVDNYVEPFAGSLAVLLGRPAHHEGGPETVNDLDCFVCNFWRALAADPGAVAHHADWPVNETDLFARHLWLVNEGREILRDGLEADPEFHDARIAGWWVWGLCAWIGSGWCSGNGPWRYEDDGDDGRGVNRQRPHLGDAGQGVNRQRPHLGDEAALHGYMRALAARLRDVRVCCGDWSRVVTTGALNYGATVGIFLDPPYSGDVRTPDLYARDDHGVSAAVAEWAIANGDDPRLRIVLAGYEGEHGMPASWRRIAYSASRSYGTAAATGANVANRHKERLWLSPSCLEPTPTLFDLGSVPRAVDDVAWGELR